MLCYYVTRSQDARNKPTKCCLAVKLGLPSNTYSKEEWSNAANQLVDAKHVLPSNTIACGTSTVLLNHKGRDKFAQDHKVFAALVLLGTQIGDPNLKPSCAVLRAKQ